MQTMFGHPSRLRLRPLRPADEAPALRAHQAVAEDGFNFLASYHPNDTWAEYLQRLEALRHNQHADPELVAATVLAATVPTRWADPAEIGRPGEPDGTLVGRVSIRHHLNDALAAWGGHIGYAIVPWARRHGYGRETLRQAIIVARAVGVDDILVTCDESNVGSARIIEACGGIYDRTVAGPGGSPKRRYWIR